VTEAVIRMMEEEEKQEGEEEEKEVAMRIFHLFQLP